MSDTTLRPAPGGRRRLWRAWIAALLLASISSLLGIASLLSLADVMAGETDARGDDELEADSTFAKPDAGGARQHDRVPDAVRVPPGTAEHIYRDLVDKLHNAYARAAEPAAVSFQQWQRANNAPYHSYSHGRRLLNNYVNETGRSYLDYEAAGPLPVGTVIATDSFAVEADGKVLPGPLFLMEKMPDGFNYVSGDWRFTLIQPDGTLVGRTMGENAVSVDHCVRCHLAAEKTDHLFFPPESYRRR